MTAILILGLMITQPSQSEFGLVLQPVGEDLIPNPPLFPDGLPRATIGPEGTFLPVPLYELTLDYIKFCSLKYKPLCKSAVDAWRKVDSELCQGEIEAASTVEIDSRYTWIERGLIGVIGLSVGVIVGLIIGTAI